MLWILLGSVAVVVAAGCSIGASWDSRRDIARGRPTFHSVADATGIWSRMRLDQLLGPRDAEDRYTATSEQVHTIPRTRWKRLFDNDLSDLACILFAAASPFFYGSHTTLSISLLAIAGSYVGIGYVVAFVVVIREGPRDDHGRGSDKT
jgi:hypothetical protein